MKVTGVRTILDEYALKCLLGDANSPRERDRASSVAIFVDSDEGGIIDQGTEAPRLVTAYPWEGEQR